MWLLLANGSMPVTTVTNIIIAVIDVSLHFPFWGILKKENKTLTLKRKIFHEKKEKKYLPPSKL